MKKNSLVFITSNSHKVEQAKSIFDEYNISFIHKKMKYDEASEDTIKQIAIKASKALCEKFNCPVFVEDTGVEFSAYPGFPGHLPKFVFNHIGYDGIFRLLDGKSKKATFYSAVGYCEPNKKPSIFLGEMKGKMISEIKSKNKNVLPYERIFVPEGYSDVLAVLPFNEKMKILHRTKSFRKLAEWLRKNFK